MLSTCIVKAGVLSRTGTVGHLHRRGWCPSDLRAAGDIHLVPDNLVPNTLVPVKKMDNNEQNNDDNPAARVKSPQIGGLTSRRA